ncbi:MAG: hypothetical protein HZB70_01230 [Candidatus Berkelbacteria bacterium]|nr:MAG: hypothetical protein HZB70_01230 [Candidatus Berkelbacteria bacterium]QQG52038.1 MAG: hypothetical protein HY845_01765 [Candidatus Berkelbacteria bacterium]
MLTLRNQNNARTLTELLGSLTGSKAQAVCEKIRHMNGIVEAINDAPRGNAGVEIVYFAEPVHNAPGGGLSHYAVYSVSTNDICVSHCYRGLYSFSLQREELLQRVLLEDDREAWEALAGKC